MKTTRVFLIFFLTHLATQFANNGNKAKYCFNEDWVPTALCITELFLFLWHLPDNLILKFTRVWSSIDEDFPREDKNHLFFARILQSRVSLSSLVRKLMYEKNCPFENMARNRVGKGTAGLKIKSNMEQNFASPRRWLHCISSSTNSPVSPDFLTFINVIVPSAQGFTSFEIIPFQYFNANRKNVCIMLAAEWQVPKKTASHRQKSFWDIRAKRVGRDMFPSFLGTACKCSVAN